MRLSLGSLPVDVTRAESARFRHPLLLVHGLWTGSWVWHGFMGYLAHRGWESWAPSFLEDDGTADGDRVALLIDVVRSMPNAPVIVGHDAGAVLAAVVATRVRVPAVVAVAPTIAGRGSPYRWPRYWPLRWFGARVAPPRDVASTVVLAGAADRLRPESGRFFRALASGSLGLPPEVVAPGLVVCAADDALSPPAAGALMAGNYGWAFEEWPQPGHAPMLGRAWESLADRVHRWLVTALGADLLAWLDEEPDGE